MKFHTEIPSNMVLDTGIVLPVTQIFHSLSGVVGSWDAGFPAEQFPLSSDVPIDDTKVVYPSDFFLKVARINQSREGEGKGPLKGGSIIDKVGPRHVMPAGLRSLSGKFRIFSHQNCFSVSNVIQISKFQNFSP